jgi:hypothetical protein
VSGQHFSYEGPLDAGIPARPVLSVERVAPDAEADFSTAGVFVSGVFVSEVFVSGVFVSEVFVSGVFVSEVFVSGVFVGEDVGLADAIGRVDDSSG